MVRDMNSTHTQPTDRCSPRLTSGVWPPDGSTRARREVSDLCARVLPVRRIGLHGGEGAYVDLADTTRVTAQVIAYEIHQ